MDALILVDIQNDFVPGGALAVPEGDQIVPLVNRLQQYFDLIVATQDWHPATHGSFANNHAGRQPGELVNLTACPRSSGPTTAFRIRQGPTLYRRWIKPVGAKSSQKALVPRSTATAAFSITAAAIRLALATTSRSEGLPTFMLPGWRQITACSLPPSTRVT